MSHCKKKMWQYSHFLQVAKQHKYDCDYQYSYYEPLGTAFGVLATNYNVHVHIQINVAQTVVSGPQTPPPI